MADTTQAFASLKSEAPTELKFRRIRPVDMSRAESSRNIHYAMIPADHSIDDIQNKEYWGHVAASVNMQERHLIEAVRVDLAFEALLFVLEVGHGWAKVALLRKTEFQTITDRGESNIPGYEIKWRDIREKFIVTRESDKKVIHTGSKTKSAALAWLEDYVGKN